jgi:hypothetical protein
VVQALPNHHHPNDPNDQNQIDVERCLKDHDRRIDLLDLASFVRKSCASRDAETRATTKLLAEVVATQADIWRDDDHFCSTCLPLASDSQLVKAGLKEAKVISTTGRNWELRSFV